MGLGPPVCLHCQVIGELVYGVPSPEWQCPICKSTDLTGHAGLFSDKWKYYEDNLKFYKFLRGIDE